MLLVAIISLFLQTQLPAAATNVNGKQIPPVVHPTVGQSLKTNEVQVTFKDRKSYYSGTPKNYIDKDVRSPKSVNIHPGQSKYYVNCLEGSKTVVYNIQTGEKLKVISHQFNEQHKDLWAPESPFYKFSYKRSNQNHFAGKPVEGTFSHNGRYFWVPYYRRSYDLNAQDPSAMAVIDTERDTIIRIFETGPLPKMVAVSADQNKLAVSHWGNNTIGIMDISSSNPNDWNYIANVIVEKELKLNFSRTEKVDRDKNSGFCLRGTVFTPDGKYLLVGCMGGGGGIAAIDVANNRYLGRIMGTKPSLRHLIIKNGYLYASINSSGYVQRIPLETIISAIQTMNGSSCRYATVTDWVSCKVPAGARTIEITPDGKYIFAACNFSSSLAVVNAETMKLIGTISADSYPVGLDVSKDGRYVLTTSQGREGHGGNSINIFEIKYL